VVIEKNIIPVKTGSMSGAGFGIRKENIMFVIPVKAGIQEYKEYATSRIHLGE